MKGKGGFRMKNMWKFSILSTILLAGNIAGIAIADDAPSIRDLSEKAFEQLTINSNEALSIQVKAKESGVKSAVKFRIKDVEIPLRANDSEKNSTSKISSDLGIKIWFELIDGTLINPTKREWKASERFYVHIQSAVPVYVGLFQNYPDSDPLSHQLYPDRKYTESFRAIQPGQAAKLPAFFEMGENSEKEIMSMVVVRFDWEGIQNGLTTRAIDSITPNAKVGAQVTEIGTGTMKSINEAVLSSKDITKERIQENIKNISKNEAEKISKAVNKAVKNTKFRIIGSKTPASDNPNDVCFYMFGTGDVGQWQLTLKK